MKSNDCDVLKVSCLIDIRCSILHYCFCLSTGLVAKPGGCLALNLLWYPAFENLFTIIRRIVANKKVQIADRSHLHILILENISKKNNLTFSNSLTGIILNLIMFFGIFLSINFYNNGKVLILIVLINISLYIISYYYFYLRRNN